MRLADQSRDVFQRLQYSWLLTAAVLLCLTSGCGRSQSDDEHEHEHEHSHHARPAHKPDNFHELPRELQRRLSRDESGAVRPSQRRQQQLREIVGWIPELAADSDLRRAGFDTAVSQQPKFQQVLDEIAAGRSPDMAVWNAAVDQLQQLADQLKSNAENQQ